MSYWFRKFLNIQDQEIQSKVFSNNCNFSPIRTRKRIREEAVLQEGNLLVVDRNRRMVGWADGTLWMIRVVE
jgi:hypothetical protein